jgi:hypothetical protein
MTNAMTPGQAARELGLSPRRVVQLADAGLLPVNRTPLGRLLDGDAVRAMAADRKAKAAA